MLEGLVGLMTELALTFGEGAQIHRMLEGTGLHVLLRRRCGVVDYRVADIAVVGDDLPGAADVLTVMTAEAAGEIQMTDVIWMRLLIGLHLGEKVSLKNALHFRDCPVNR